MPITGKFIADFTAFNDAVKKASVELIGMETHAGKVGTSLNKMVDQFSGRKVIQEAELMVQAFELLQTKGIGLTTSELERMGAVGAEAIEKLRASGEPIPAGMQKIVDSAKQIAPPLDAAKSSAVNFFGSLQKAAGIVGIAFSIGAIKNFIGSVFETASAVQDMSAKLGISAEATQKFKYAAEQTGTTIDTVGTAIGTMNRTLAEGERGTIDLLKSVGLQFDEIRRMTPDQAFLEITEAIKGIKDPMEQARVAVELFGRSGQELLPGIKEGFGEIAKGAAAMSDATVKELAEAQDAWEGFFNWLTVQGGKAISGATKIGKELVAALSTAAADPSGRGSGLDEFAREAKASATASQLDALVRSGQALAEGGVAVGKNWGAIPGVIKGSTLSMEDLDAIVKELGHEERRTRREIEESAAAMKKLKEEWEGYIAAALKRGDADIKHEKQLEGAIKNVNHEMDLFVNKHLKDVAEKGQKTLSEAGDAAVKFGLDMSGLHPVVAGLGDEFNKSFSTGILAARNMPPEIKKSEDALNDLSTSLTQLATVSAGSFSSVVSGLASLVVGANTAKTSIKEIQDAANAKSKFEGILGMTSGILGLITVAIQAVNAIKGIWTAIAGRGGRHAVEDFAESFGGFDALHAKLAELGDEGDRLWKSLTQGVGANNPAEAARVIAEVEAALAKQTEAQEDVTAATEEQAQATIETASQATKALEELGPKIKTNEDEWRGWGDVVTAQIQRIADAVRALALPTMPGAAAIGAGAGGGSMAFSNKTTLILDGEVVGETVARQIMQA